MDRCHHCPADPKLTCTAIRRNHPRYCELTDPQGPSYRPEYVKVVVEQSEAEAPGLLDMAVSVTKAVVRFAGDHGRIAPDEVRAERERICRACEQHNPTLDTCKICGCALKLKRGMPLEKCPIGKWLAV